MKELDEVEAALRRAEQRVTAIMDAGCFAVDPGARPCGSCPSCYAASVWTELKAGQDSLAPHRAAVERVVEAADDIGSALQGERDTGGSVGYYLLGAWGDRLRAALSALEKGGEGSDAP